MGTQKSQEWADSPAKIAKAATMDVTLLSGLKVTLRTVTLDELALDDAIPGDLIEVAILDSADLLLPQMLENVRAQKPEEAQRLSRNATLLADRVVKHALVKPAPTAKVLAALDGFDKKLIVELAQRKRSTDATGKVVAAQVLADYATFPEEQLGDEDRSGSGENEPVAGAVG